MNCLEFRRKLMVEPTTSEAEFKDHAAACESCAREAERAFHFEDQLCAALGVQTPSGLQSPTLSIPPTPPPKVGENRGTRWLAAASLFMAVAISGWLGYHWEQYFHAPTGLEQLVLHHIQDELEHLHRAEDVDRSRLASLLSGFGAEVRADIGEINFASRCNMKTSPGIHLVISGEQGPVTVLMMPGEFLQQERVVHSSRFAGVIVPTGYGSMAVVGERAEPVAQVVERIRRAVVWGA